MSNEASLEQLEKIYTNRDQQGMLEALDKVQAIIEFELDGTIIAANQNFLDTLNYAIDDIIGEHHKMFCDDEYVSSPEYTQMWQDLANGIPKSGEFRRIGKNGEELWLQATYTTLLDNDGKPYKIVKFARDVTSQKDSARSFLRKQTAFENSSAAMMTVDRDFVVTEVNQATKDLLARSADVFAQIWPDFDPESIIGTCIDMFHKNPAHQRQMLADPSNLPFKTDITIGDFKFALNVGGIFDETGAYVGNILEWDDVTEERMNTGILSALDKSQAAAEFAIDGRVLNANAIFLEMTGYQRAEIVGESHAVFLHADDTDTEANKAFWLELGEGKTQEGQFKRLAKDGSVIWIQASYNPIIDGNGNVFKVVLFAANITDQKKADQTNLRKTTGFENSSSAMMMVDRDFIVTEVNKATEELLARSADVFAQIWPNFKPENIVGTCIDMFHKNPAHQRAMLSNPNNLPFRTDITIGDFKFALNVGGIFDEAGSYVGNILEWDDVTESRMNAGVLSALDRTQAIVEYSVGGVIQKANDNFSNISGYTSAEVVGKHYSSFVDAAHAASSEYKEFWNSLALGKNQEGEFKIFDKNGAEVWVQGTFNPILDANGTVFKIVQFATDVTNLVAMRKMAETLSLVANETDNSVVICDAKGLIEYINPGFTKLTGYSMDEAIGKKPGELLQGKLTSPETVLKIREKLDAQTPFYEEILNYDKAGEPYWIALAINPVF